LQDRSFALARHQIREWLFDLNEKPPEPWGPGMRRLLLAYAFATWTYRLVLFVGIAFVVYHTFFKALGILLFAIEVWWFIARPIVRELGEWNRRWRGRRLNGRTAVTATLAALLLGALLVPWRTTIYAPAVLTAEVRAQLFSQVAGQVAAIHVRSGAQVRAGDVLVELVSPEIAYRLQQARRKVEGLAAQISALSQISETQSRAQQVRQELEGARAELSAAETEQTRLAIKSPTDGIVVDLADPMGIGEWVKASEPIATVIEPTKWRVNAYVSEEDFGRIKVGAPASFIPADVAGPRQTATVLTIDYAATRILSDSELSSNYGGPIAARSTANDLQVPELPVYRVTLAPEAHARPAQTSLGTAIITGESRSVAIQLWRRVASVLIRESGF
jgi:putative peptide zinc metalloprotease protein